MAIALTVEFKQVGAEKLANDISKVSASGDKLTTSLARSKVEAESLRRTVESASVLNTPVAKAADAFERGQRGLKLFINDIRGGIGALQELATAGSLTSLSFTSMLGIVFDLGELITAVLNPDKLVKFFVATKQSVSELLGLSSAAKTATSSVAATTVATQGLGASLSALLFPVLKIAAVIGAVVAVGYAVYRAFVIIEQETKILQQGFSAVKNGLDAFVRALGLGTSASEVFARIVSVCVAALRYLVNFIVGAVATALQYLLRLVSLVTQAFITLINISQKVLSVFNLQLNSLNATKAGLEAFKKGIDNAASSLDIVRNKAQNTTYTLDDFRNGVMRSASSVFDFEQALRNARRELEATPQGGLKAYLIDLREQMRLFQAQGKQYLAMITNIKATDLAQKIKPDKEDYETLKKLETDAEIAKEAIKKEVKDIQATARQIRAKIKIDAAVDAGDFDKALQLEISNNKRIKEIQEAIADLRKAGGAGAQELISALQTEYSALVSEMRKKYQDMSAEKLKSLQQEQQKAKEEYEKLVNDELSLLDKKLAEEIKKYQQFRDKKFINEQEYQQAVAKITENYENEKSNLILQRNIETLNKLKSVYEQYEIPIPKGLSEQLKAMQEAQLEPQIPESVRKFREELDAAIKSIDDFFDNLDLVAAKAPPLQKFVINIKDSAKSIQREIALLRAGLSDDFEALIKAVADFGASYSDIMQQIEENSARLKDIGNPLKADELKESVELFKRYGKELSSQFTTLADSIAANKDVIKNALEKNLVNVTEEQKEKVIAILKELGISIEEQMKENASIFERYNFETVQGITEAFTDFVENFQSISPGKVFSEIVALGFNRGALVQAAAGLGKSAAATFAEGLRRYNLPRVIKGIWQGVSAGILQILSNAKMLITLVDFFAKPTKEFREGLDKFLRNIFYAIERISKNLPTLIVSIVANAPRFVVKAMIDLFFRLLPTLVAIIPLMVNRFLFALVESLGQLPRYLLQSLDYSFTLIKSTVIELFGSIIVEIIEKVPPQFLNAGYVIASSLVYGIEAYQAIVAEKWTDAIQASSRVVSDIAISVGNSLKNTTDAMLSYAIGGFSRLVTATTNFIVVFRASNKRSIEAMSNLVSGLENTFVGVIMLFAKNKRDAAEWGAAMIAIFTAVKAAIHAFAGDFAGVAKTLAVGATSTLAILQAAGDKTRQTIKKTVSDARKFNDQFEIKMKIGTEDDEDAVKKDIENKINQAKKVSELMNKRVGSAEFKVKDVQDTDAEKQIRDFALRTEDAVKNTAGVLKDSLSPLENAEDTMFEFEPNLSGMSDLFDNFLLKLKDSLLSPFYAVGNWLDSNIFQPFARTIASVFWSVVNVLSALFRFETWASLAFNITKAVLDLSIAIFNFTTQFAQKAFEVLSAVAVWIYESVLVPLGNILSKFIADLFVWLAPFAQEFLTFLGNLATTLGGWLVSFGVRIAELSNAMWQAIKSAAVDFARVIADNAALLAINVRDAVASGLRTLGNIFYDFVVMPLVNAFIEHVVNPIKGVVQAPQKTVERAGSWVGEQARKVGKWLGFAYGGVVPVVKKLPIYMAAQGMIVPGGSAYASNSYARDTVPALLSAGEVVLPNSVTQRPDLMRDIAAVLSGERPREPVVNNIITSSNITIQQSININIEPKTVLSKQEVEKEIAPVIIDAIKSASERGKAVISKRGVY